MRVPPSRIKYYVLGFYLLLLAIWQAFFSAQILPDFLFPSPWQVARRLWELTADNYLWPSFQATFQRIGIGFSIAGCTGLVIGLVMGLSGVMRACLRSLFLGLQTLPTAAWVPVSLLFFGLSEHGIYFVIIMSSAPAVALAASDGIQHIPLIYLRVARTLGTPAYAMPLRVLLPASLPSVVTGLKMGWTLAWHGGVSAELIKSSIGLGFLLQMGRELNDAAQVIGIMVLTILGGLLLDRFLFGLIQKRILVRWGLAPSSSG
jgi:NitT/TauT family transport system permease protein